jgi:hypothetical protein
VALALIAAGLLHRVLVALPGFLSPDEADNFLVASNPTLSVVIRGAPGTPYPAFYLIFLHFWRLLGTSDFMLRLPSIIAGTAALWFAFRWLVVAFNRTTGLAGLILLAFAPTPVTLLTEVGPSSFVLLFAAAGLLLLELAFQRKSALTMACSGLLFVLTLASHASAVWLLASLGLYGIVRVILERPPKAVTTAWAAGQAAIVLLAVCGYVTRFLPARAGAGGAFAHASWLSNSYFRPGEESLLFFPIRQTTAFFQYIFASSTDGIGAMLISAVGIAILLVTGWKARKLPIGSRGTGLWTSDFEPWTFLSRGLLLVLPFASVCAAAIGRAYPYGGTSDGLVLLLPAMAGVGFTVAMALGHKIWPVLAAAVVLVPVWITGANRAPDRFPPANQHRESLAGAVAYINQVVPPGRLIFSDMSTQAELRRYLRSGMTTMAQSPSGRFVEYDHGGFRLVGTRDFRDFPADSFGDEFARVAQAYGLQEGDTVCVASIAPDTSLVIHLFRRYRLEPPVLGTFGDNIGVFQLPVGEEPSAANLRGRDERAERALEALMRLVPTRTGDRFQAVLWPTNLLNDSTRRIAGTLSGQVIPYAELYDSLAAGAPLSDYLPALAFWQFRTTEMHPGFMRYMDDAENYIANGQRFTLALTSPDSTAAVYVVQPAAEQASPMPAR